MSEIKGNLNAPHNLKGYVIPRGEDGISPVVETSEIEGGYRVDITDIYGKKSIDLMHGEKGDKGDAFTYSDFTPVQLAALKGEPGYTPQKNVDYFDGSNGKDGYSATHSWNGTTLTITSAAGTSSADLKGDKGDSIKGDTGSPGYTPIKGVDYFDGDKGDKGDPGYTPQKGVDYFDGKDGVSATHSWNGTTLTVTSASGTSSANLKGDKGDKGDRGEQGTGVTILGSYDSESALKAAHPTGKAGDGYLVNGNLYVWSESSSTWANVGNIKGPKGDTGEAGYTPRKGVDYFDGQNGKDGTSVTVASVSESTADGGSNVVNFSDGKTITIKNGSKGSTGDPGYTPQKNVDYFDGKDGIPGKDGSNGVSCTHSWNGTTLIVTSASGTSSANLKGDKGDKGDTGEVDYGRLNNYAKIASANNLLHNGNEFTFVPSGYTGQIYINHQTAGGANGNITNYYFGNGKGGLATFIANYFKGKFQGDTARPIYNNEEAAMLSDVPTNAAQIGAASATDFANLRNEFDALAASAVSVLSGTATPTSDIGSDGDIYLVTE